MAIGVGAIVLAPGIAVGLGGGAIAYGIAAGVAIGGSYLGGTLMYSGLMTFW